MAPQSPAHVPLRRYGCSALSCCLCRSRRTAGLVTQLECRLRRTLASSRFVCGNSIHYRLQASEASHGDTARWWDIINRYPHRCRGKQPERAVDHSHSLTEPRQSESGLSGTSNIISTPQHTQITPQCTQILTDWQVIARLGKRTTFSKNCPHFSPSLAAVHICPFFSARLVFSSILPLC